MASKTAVKIKSVTVLTVPQAVLQTIARTRTLREKLQARIDALDERLKPMETTTIEALENGYVIEPGPCQAAVTTSSRRCPAWKEEFIVRLGEPAAAEVIAKTEPSITKKLVLSGKV